MRALPVRPPRKKGKDELLRDTFRAGEKQHNCSLHVGEAAGSEGDAIALIWVWTSLCDTVTRPLQLPSLPSPTGRPGPGKWVPR